MSADELPKPEAYPVHTEAIPTTVFDTHGFRVAFARTERELEACQRLRFEVFNLEMNEGLEESYLTGLDQDRFDPVNHHLIVEDKSTGQVVGTYRMQISDMARMHGGFYTNEEFCLDQFPEAVINDAVEVGRACVAKPYRNSRVLFLLWKGLGLYLLFNRKRYLFGCCSLTSQDPAEARRMMDHLVEHGHTHPQYFVDPRPDWVCYADDAPAPAPAPVTVPKLFALYLKYGAKVCSKPALDRQFKTIDYLVLSDLADLGEHTRELFFPPGSPG